MGVTRISDEGLPTGQCEDCGDLQNLHKCIRCDLDKCEFCYGETHKYNPKAPCNDCLETYPDEFRKEFPDFYESES